MAGYHSFPDSMERNGISRSRNTFWISSAVVVTCCTLGALLIGHHGAASNHAMELQQVHQRRGANEGVTDWERQINSWSDGVMLFGILDGNDGTSMRPSSSSAAAPTRRVASAALRRGPRAAVAVQGQSLAAQQTRGMEGSRAAAMMGKQMMLWNAAAGDEINSNTLGRRHPSDAASLWEPKIGGLGHTLTEDEFLENRQKTGAHVVSDRDMTYHPLKWMQSQGEPGSRLARFMSLADAYGSQLKEANHELSEVHAVESAGNSVGNEWRKMLTGKHGKYWWNVKTGRTQWHSPEFDQVRAEQSKLLGVHNEGVEGELKQLKAMAKLN